ncbi:hypothetical protein HMPREF0454_01098 [Hafnia alvei ATCC 51873]|uniref:Uncharacterized protein n=1 Tax=Hafnia alvei ATCC 51873 TaxID=1002364 RepID=G9Y3L0_HAFAL|nr:hypothetical protein HMPREF0454_01098 [Hafnia alvei ATCC 51873]
MANSSKITEKAVNEGDLISDRGKMLARQPSAIALYIPVILQVAFLLAAFACHLNAT